MSYLDVLKQLGGASDYADSDVEVNKPKYRDVRPVGQVNVSSGKDGAAAARNSRERTAPERIDVSGMFAPPVPEGEQGPNVPLQAFEVVGKAPGFIAERPLAVAQSLLTDEETGESPFDFIGKIPGAELVGDVVGNVSNFMGSLMNNNTAEVLKKGVSEGWSDDQIVVGSGSVLSNDAAWSQALKANPLTGAITGLLDQISGKAAQDGFMKDRPDKTWGEFKADAARRGFSADDVQGLLDGTKNTYDFGDRSIVSDPLTDMAIRMATDPTNIMFGAGAAFKAVQGVGLLGKAVKAGAIAGKLEAPSVVAANLAANASMAGIEAGSRGATWLGLAKSFGSLGQSLSAVPGATRAVTAGGNAAGLGAKALKAYQKVAIGTTAVQAGLLGLEQTPLSGPLAGLFDINKRAWDNQPLSNNMAFSLFTAFHFDLSHLAGKGLGQLKGAKRAALGDDTRARMLDALAEDFHGPGKKASHNEVIEALGGPSVLDDLIVHTHAQASFERIMQNPVIKATMSHFDSLDEAMLKNKSLADMITTIVADDMKSGRTNGSRTVEGFKRWFAQRSGVEQPIDFPWNGRQAVEKWTQFAGAATSVQQIFRQRGDVVMGLVDTLMSEDVWNLQALARISGGANKQVPVATVRAWLDRFPTLIDSEHAVYGRDAQWWSKFLSSEFDGQTIPLGKLEGKLKRLGKDAPSARDLTSEMAAAERQAGQGEWVGADVETYSGPGVATINVSRVRPSIVKRLKINASDIDSASTARTDPEIAAFEGRAGEELSKIGIRVDDTTQAIGLWEGQYEASLEVNMSEATLPEMRLAAALLGSAGKQDAVAIAVGGRRMRELGLTANGYEIAFSLPNTEREALRAVSSAVSREFEGATINDTNGLVRILVPEGAEAEVSAKLARISSEIDGLYERDLLGASTIKTSAHPAYIEFLDKKKGSYGNATYADVLRESKSYGDERAGSAAAFADAVAYRRPASPDASAGLGSVEAVGRDASNGGPATGAYAKPPAERVGLGRVAEATVEPGYLYHATKAENLAPIAGDRLKPQSPAGIEWPDGGRGARTFYSKSPIDALPFGDSLIRVREADAGRVRIDPTEGQSYSQKGIPPTLAEVWGADGQWHRLDTWFEQTVDPEIAASAAQVQGVYSSPSVARVQFRDRMKAAFELDDVQADDVAALADARARAWASMSEGRTAEQWYEKNFAGIERGGESAPDALNQITRRNEAVEAALGKDESLRVLIEEAEPPILAEYGLEGAGELEWTTIELPRGGTREIAIPGGIAGLAEGEFSLWDLWRLKAQGIDPKLMPEDMRRGVYGKLFRSQRRALTSVPDVFNRMAFAILSPQTNLTQNEALLSFVRAQDEGAIARLAEIADSMGPDAKATDIGFAIQKAVGLDNSVNTLGVGIKTITTNGNLGAVGRLAQLMRDDPTFFTIREGEDLLAYSERLMNVTPGAGMKVGNFAAMLGNPLEWDRGTIDSHIVQQLVDEGRLDPALAARLKGQSPSAQEIVYRSKKTGEINPDVPEHLRDLPIEPSDNKVRVYGGDYAAVNEALKAKFAESGLGDDFGLGAYQWYVWDQKRGRLEPHTIIYPGSHALPPIDQAALSTSLKAHKAGGYLGGKGTQPLPGMAMSPRDAFFYQEATPKPIRTARDLTDTELYALDNWQRGANANTPLRAGREPDRTGQALDGMLERVAPTTAPMTLYRGVGSDVAPEILHALTTGSTFSDPGFVATSRSLKQAFDYGPEGLRVRVEVPAGSRVLPVDKLAEVKLPSREVLLPRGSQFDVRMAGNQIVLTLRQAPDPDYSPTPGQRARIQGEIDRLTVERDRFQATVDEKVAINEGGGGIEWYQDLVDRVQGKIDKAQERMDSLTPRWAKGAESPLDQARSRVESAPAVGPGFINDFSSLRKLIGEFGGPRDGFQVKRTGARWGPGEEVVLGRYDAKGDLVGVLRMAVDDNGVPTGQHIAVDPHVQRQGIAQSLYAEAERQGFDILNSIGETGLSDAGRGAARRYLDSKSPRGVDPETGAAIQAAYDAKDPVTGQRLQREAMDAPGAVPGFGVPPGTQRLSELAQRSLHDEELNLFRERTVRQSGPDTIIKGSTQFLEDNRAILRGLESPDVSTGIHELAHVVANELDDADLEILRRVHGDNPEGMPRDFERWLREGKAPVPELEGVFTRMAGALRRIYAVLRGSPLEKKIHPEMRAMFERLFEEVEPENTQMFDPTPDTLTAGLRAQVDGITAPGQVQWMAARDRDVSSSIPFHRSLSELDDASKAELSALEQNLRTHYPEYTLQAAPNPAIMLADQGDIATRYLRDRTWLGNVLAAHGPMGRVTNLVDWLTKPVPNSQLGRNARTALMNELISKGAKPKEVDAFIQALAHEAGKHTLGPLDTRIFGSGRALLPKTINRIAAGDSRMGIPGVFSDATINIIGRDNFARVMDRASNRFIRTLDERVKKGGRRGALARAVTGTYGAYSHTFVGDTTRIVGKTMYPLFRFIADPRWWAMNILEADFISGARYGMGSTRFQGANKASPGRASLMHEHQAHGSKAAKLIENEMADNNGMLWTRGHAGYISRSFDSARPETTLAALRDLPDNDPVLQGLRDIIEAEDAKAGRTRTAGELVDGDYVAAIDRLLYEVDVKGAKAAITDEANAILGGDETARLMPFLQKVWEANDATHKAITESLTGNTSRTNLERIGNSYWLYWPLSYQIKATKWLVDIMTNRFMGAKTNLAPSALYAHHVEEHRKRLASNPEYAAMFEDNQTAWFMAQMLFPMTPGDIGVSLSRAVRFAGGELGIWGKYKSAEDPITAAAAISLMGPTYTAELLARLGSEIYRKPADNLAP